MILESDINISANAVEYFQRLYRNFAFCTEQLNFVIYFYCKISQTCAGRVVVFIKKKKRNFGLLYCTSPVTNLHSGFEFERLYRRKMTRLLMCNFFLHAV